VSANLLSLTAIIRLRFIRGGSIHQEEPIRRMRNSVLPSDLRRFIGLPIKFVILDEFEKAKNIGAGRGKRPLFKSVSLSDTHSSQKPSKHPHMF
jgi:hypothetical protein